MVNRNLTTGDVVAAAAEVADRPGGVEMTVSAVADHLGVTQSALYRHVTGLEDLQRRVAILARRELRDRLLDATAGRSSDQALRELAEAWRSYVVDHTGRYAMTDRTAVAGDEEAEEAVRLVVAVVIRVLEGFGIEASAAVPMAWAIRASLHGFAVLEASGGTPTDVDRDGAFDHLVSTLLVSIVEHPN